MSWVLAIVIILVVAIFLGAIVGFIFWSSSSKVIPNPPQTTPLRLTNNFDQDIWVNASAGAYSYPLPGQANTLIQIPARGYKDIPISNQGLVGARFWAQYGCDDTGKNCLFGSSVPLYTGDPCPFPDGCPNQVPFGGPCGTQPCQPPSNSLGGEFTFGCFTTDRTQCTLNPSNNLPLDAVTYYDSSAVDGVSLPFHLIVKNSSGTGCNPINATQLDLTNCPTNADLSFNGITTATNPQTGEVYDLTSVDLRYYDQNSQILSCMSPCTKLTNVYGFNIPIPANPSPNDPVSMYCCPSPISAETCRAGPAANNAYTQFVRDVVPNVYTFAYDDVNALNTCGETTQYEIVFGSEIIYPAKTPVEGK